MHHHNQHNKIRLVGAVALAMLVGLLVGGERAHAQVPDDSSARASDSASAERAIAPEVEPLTIDTPDVPAVSDDATTANGTDDSAAHPGSANSDVEYAPSVSIMSSDEASGSASANSAVLEIPQVVNLSNGDAANAPADEASANSDGNDDDTAQSGQNGQDTAGGHDLAATGGDVGTLTDYENQAGQTPPHVIFFGPVVRVVPVPRPPLFCPLPRPLGVPIARSPIILPPSSSGPFPSTSPMLMAPRFGTFGSFPHIGAFPSIGPHVGAFPNFGPRIGAFPRGGFIGARR
ncbi:MAG: hypothetical protein JO071_03805 [Deltaproteobacteria bacterium]|nr:hypothetical protein [Deltaproteobacteria bacterium]